MKSTLFLILFFCFGLFAQNAITLKINLKVPEYTPTDGPVCIVGNLPELGAWDPAKIKMNKTGDKTYGLELSIPKGSTLEYKYTRGSWDTVEKGENFSEMDNRRKEIGKDETISDTVLSWADSDKTEKKHTLTGNIKFHEGFYSKILDNKRTLAVYLPPSYETNQDKKYPALYMHDGQNIFDAATSFLGIEWQADEAAQSLANMSKINEIIIVGIYNNDKRMEEYTPFADKKRKGGKGKDYSEFVVKEVKPFIDKTYRTLPDRENTAVAGSSLGGLISLHLLVEYPDIFSAAGVLSPALYWSDYEILKRAQKADPKKMKIWISMGDEEGEKTGNLKYFTDAINDSRKLQKILIKKGFTEKKNLLYYEEKGGRHNETYWAKLMPDLLEFFFKIR